MLFVPFLLLLLWDGLSVVQGRVQSETIPSSPPQKRDDSTVTFDVSDYLSTTVSKLSPLSRPLTQQTTRPVWLRLQVLR